MKTLKRVPYRGYGVHQNQGPAGIWYAVRLNRQTVFQAPTFEACMNWVDAQLNLDVEKYLDRVVRSQETKEKTMKQSKLSGAERDLAIAKAAVDATEDLTKRQKAAAQKAKRGARKGHTLPSEPTAEFKPGQPVAVIAGGKPVPGFEFVERRGKFFIVKNTKKGSEHRVWLNKLQAA